MGSEQSHPLRHGGIGAAHRPEALARSNFHKGNERFKDSDYRAAIVQYRRAIDKLKNAGHERHYLTSTALSNLGCMEFAEGRYDEAVTLLKEAIDKLKTAHQQGGGDNVSGSEEMKDSEVSQVAHIEEDDQSMKSMMMKLTRDPYMVGENSQDKEQMIHSLEEHSTIDAITADACNNIAACYEFLGVLEESKNFYNEALHLRRLLYGNRSAKVAESLQNLGTVLDKQGHLLEAQEMYEQALSVFRETLGERSADTAMVYSNLGLLYNTLGKLDSAEEYLKKSLSIREENPLYGDASDIQATKKNLQYIANKKHSITRYLSVGHLSLEVQSQFLID